MATPSYDRMADPVGLTEAARRLGICTSSARDLVHQGRLPAVRIGPLWYVERQALEQFAASYRRRPYTFRPRPTSNTDSREKVARLLAEWQSATPDELAVGIGLHPGNVRKHLAILASDGVAERDAEGLWHLTAVGQRLQEEIAEAS